MIHASVIIPTFNRSESLKTTLINISQLNYPHEDLEIIVIDNNSTDNTPETVEEIQKNFPFKLSYFFERKTGLHYGRHTGAKNAHGEILVYIDDDVLCGPEWMSELLKPYTNVEVGCVGGKILPKFEVDPPQWIQPYTSFLSLLDLGDSEIELTTPMLYGCNFSVRKNILFESGGFNPDGFGSENMIFFRGDGEIGLLKKISRQGKKIIYAPRAVIWHVIPQSRLSLEYFKRRAYIEGISHSFVIHREQKWGLLKTISEIGKLAVRIVAYKIMAIKNTIVQNRDGFIKFEINYSGATSRLFYECKFLFNKELQLHVRKATFIE